MRELILTSYCIPRISEFSEKFFQKEKDVPDDEAVPNLKHLVPVKTSGNKIPIYIIAGTGTALRFMKFPGMLDEDQPVYVIQPPVETKDLKDFPKTVEEISNKFIDEITQTNPNGPYALSGHCAGGIFAFEMSKQWNRWERRFSYSRCSIPLSETATSALLPH